MTTRTIETVFLDAGGVLCHPSWNRVAGALVRHGVPVLAATDNRARGWLYFNLVLQHAGVDQNAEPK